jgi:hypothetical protein
MTNTSMADLRISEFIESTSSDRISPGAIAVALGAAWAEKAVSISLKPSPHDPSLAMALVGLEKVHSFALQWRRGLHEGRIAHVTGYYDSVKMTALFRG